MLHAFTPTDSTSACSLSGFHWVSRYFRTVTIRTCHRALIDLRLPACSTPPARPSRNRTELPFTPGCTLGRPVSLFRVGYISVSWLLNSSSPPILVQVSPVVRCKYMSATACRTKKTFCRKSSMPSPRKTAAETANTEVRASAWRSRKTL